MFYVVEVGDSRREEPKIFREIVVKEGEDIVRGWNFGRYRWS
jgi:hypothetical protein